MCVCVSLNEEDSVRGGGGGADRTWGKKSGLVKGNESTPVCLQPLCFVIAVVLFTGPCSYLTTGPPTPSRRPLSPSPEELGKKVMLIKIKRVHSAAFQIQNNNLLLDSGHLLSLKSFRMKCHFSRGDAK